MQRRISLVIAGRFWRALAVVAACASVGLTVDAEPPARTAAEHVVHVRAGGDLQAALNAAPAGATIALAPGARFLGTFVLPAHEGAAVITLTTDGSVPDRRVMASDSGKLAVLQSPGNEPALRAAPGASHWRVVGLEIAANTSPGGTAVEIGSAEAARLEDVPSDIVLDRLLVRGDPIRGLKRGIALNGCDLTLTRSSVTDIKRQGQDAQAVWANNGPGPYTIRDNFLEASGENIMFGGDTPRIRDLVPSDITIEGNTISKPLEWRHEHWDVKNLLELKSARHVVIRHNTFSGNWVSAQPGYAIVFSPRNQYGTAPWTIVEDVRFEDNVVTDVSSGINLTGDDNEHPSKRTERIVIRNNLVVADRARFGGDGRFLMIGRAPESVIVEHNTTITNGSSWIYTYKGGSADTSEGLVVRDNVALHNTYGFMGEGAGIGKAALAKYYRDPVFEGYVLAGGSASEYPPGNLFPDVAEFKAQFIDFASGDYRLTPESKLSGRGAALPLEKARRSPHGR